MDNTLKLVRYLIVFSSIAFGQLDLTVPGASIRVAIVTGGHWYDTTTFAAMFTEYPDIQDTILNVPDDGSLFDNIENFPYDAIVLFNFQQNLTQSQKANFLALLDRGIGIMVFHHALGSYNAWDTYDTLAGAKYYVSNFVAGGVAHKASTYMEGMHISVDVVDTADPILKGVSRNFTVYDECYKGMSFTPQSHLLLQTSNLNSDGPLAWTRQVRKSRVFTLQLGHGMLSNSIYLNSDFRKVFFQGLRWVAIGNLSAIQSPHSNKYFALSPIFPTRSRNLILLNGETIFQINGKQVFRFP